VGIHGNGNQQSRAEKEEKKGAINALCLKGEGRSGGEKVIPPVTRNGHHRNKKKKGAELFMGKW